VIELQSSQRLRSLLLFAFSLTLALLVAHARAEAAVGYACPNSGGVTVWNNAATTAEVMFSGGTTSNWITIHPHEGHNLCPAGWANGKPFFVEAKFGGENVRLHVTNLCGKMTVVFHGTPGHYAGHAECEHPSHLMH
jgi:hypothetical protein